MAERHRVLKAISVTDKVIRKTDPWFLIRKMQLINQKRALQGDRCAECIHLRIINPHGRTGFALKCDAGKDPIAIYEALPYGSEKSAECDSFSPNTDSNSEE